MAQTEMAGAKIRCVSSFIPSNELISETFEDGKFELPDFGNDFQSRSALKHEVHRVHSIELPTHKNNKQGRYGYAVIDELKSLKSGLSLTYNLRPGENSNRYLCKFLIHCCILI